MIEHRFKLIYDVHQGKKTSAEVATKLKCLERTVKQLVTIHKDNLRVIVPLIDMLLQPVNSKRDQAVLKEKLAELLGVTYRQVGRLIETADIKVPTPLVVVERKKRRLNARSRIFMRSKKALDVIAGLTDAKDAAEDAEITPKHMYRLCGEMIAKHGIVFRDLKHMAYDKRKALADSLEKELTQNHDKNV